MSIPFSVKPHRGGAVPPPALSATPRLAVLPPPTRRRAVAPEHGHVGGGRAELRRRRRGAGDAPLVPTAPDAADVPTDDPVGPHHHPVTRVTAEVLAPPNGAVVLPWREGGGGERRGGC